MTTIVAESDPYTIIKDLYVVRDGKDDLWGGGEPDGTQVIWEGGYFRAVLNHDEGGSWKKWQHWSNYQWQDMVSESGRPTDPGEDRMTFITGGTQNVVGALLNSVTYWQMECIKLRREIAATSAGES